MKQVNNVVKTVPKAKNQGNKPSFYIVLGLIIFCIIGSMLGTLSFFKVHAEDPEYNVIEYPNIIESSNYIAFNDDIYNGYHFSFDSTTQSMRIFGSPVDTSTHYTNVTMLANIPVLANTDYSFYFYSTVSNGLAFYSNQLTNGSISASNSFNYANSNTHTSITFVLRLDNTLIDSIDTNCFMFMWQGNWELQNDIEQSIAYQVGLQVGFISGYNDGYNTGYTVGAGSFESSLGIFSQASFKYYFSDSMSFRDSDISTYHFDNDYYSFLSTDNVLFDGYYNGVYIHYQGLDNFYFDSSNKSWDNLITSDTKTFIVRAFFSEYGIDFSNLYMFTTFTKTGGIFYNRFVSIGQNICFWFSDGTSLNYSSADSFYSSFDLLQYSSKKLVAIDFYTNRSDIELPSLMTDINAGTSYTLGYEDGFFDGRSSSSDTAYTKGYDAGYSAGVHNSGDYTFFGLMSAVLDAPVQAFSGLFNFNIFGINFLSIFTFLITLAVVIKILSLLK